MTETPGEARLRRLRGRVNAVTTLLAIVSVVLAVRGLVLAPSVGVELDSPAFALEVWLSLASVGLALAVPLVYAAALLVGVRPAHGADVVRGVLTILLAWLPLVWLLGMSPSTIVLWTLGVVTLSVLFAISRLGLRIAAGRRAAATSTPAPE